MTFFQKSIIEALNLFFFQLSDDNKSLFEYDHPHFFSIVKVNI